MANEANAEVVKFRPFLEPIKYCPRIHVGVGQVKDEDVRQGVKTPVCE
jgi:hypothetical protein